MSEEKDYLKLLEEAAQKKLLSPRDMAMVELAMAIVHSLSVSVCMLEALISNGSIAGDNQKKAVGGMQKSVNACNEFLKMTVKSLGGAINE